MPVCPDLIQHRLDVAVAMRVQHHLIRDPITVRPEGAIAVQGQEEVDVPIRDAVHHLPVGKCELLEAPTPTPVLKGFP